MCVHLIGEDLVWCDECGAGMPWKHAARPRSLRRWLVLPLTNALGDVINLASAAHAALLRWADRPERQRYAAHIERRATR